MTPRGYVQRLVARHAEPLALRPRATPRFGPSALSIADTQVERGITPRHAGREAPGVNARRDEVRFESAADAGRVHPLDQERRDGTSGAARAEDRRGVDATASEPGPNQSTGLEPPRVQVTDDDRVPVHVVAPDLTPRQAGRTSAPYEDTAQFRKGLLDAESSPDIAHDAVARGLRARHAAARDLPSHVSPESIHVHIGRIEVRAVTPAPDRPVTSPRAAGPEPLSLDSYLARRARQ